MFPGAVQHHPIVAGRDGELFADILAVPALDNSAAERFGCAARELGQAVFDCLPDFLALAFAVGRILVVKRFGVEPLARFRSSSLAVIVAAPIAVHFTMSTRPAVVIGDLVFEDPDEPRARCRTAAELLLRL